MSNTTRGDERKSSGPTDTYSSFLASMLNPSGSTGGYLKPIAEDLLKMYNMVDYYTSFSILGTALEKISQFMISNIYVTVHDIKNKEKAERILRKIKLKQQMQKGILRFLQHGLTAISPTMKTTKVLTCKECGKAYDLRDLIEFGKPLYKLKKTKYYYKCTNPDCPAQGKEAEFSWMDKVGRNPSDINIAVWGPRQLSTVENEITGENHWFVSPPPAMRKYIQKNNPYIIAHTRQIYIEAAQRNKQVKINENSAFILKSPGPTIMGKPIPPTMRAMRSAILLDNYHNANNTISKSRMVPLRMLFSKTVRDTPVHIDTKGGEYKKYIKSELEEWKKNKDYIPYIPVELGFKDFFGDGKLYTTEKLMKASVSDMLAQIGTPVEIIYGGATWSRQNTSAIILENTFKVIAEVCQEPLDLISERINKVEDMKCRIRIKSPRIVDSLRELSLLQEGKEKREISNSTYYKRLGLNFKDEAKLSKSEAEIVNDAMEARAVGLAKAQVGARKIEVSAQKVIRQSERQESLKDSLTMQAIKQDDLISQVRAQKDILKTNLAAQIATMLKEKELNSKMLKEQAEMQKDLGKTEQELGIESAKEQAKLQADMMKTQLGLNIEGMKEQAFAEQEVQEEMQARQAAKQQQELMELGKQAVSPEDLQGLSEEEAQQVLMTAGQQAQMQQMYQGLEPEEKEKVDAAEEGEKESILQRIVQEKTMEEQDPKAIKEKQKMKSEKSKEQEDIKALTSEYLRMSPGEKRKKWEEELMVEDAAKYSKVKALARNIVAQKYSTEIINSTGNENRILKEVERKFPDMMDDVKGAVKMQMQVSLQALQYAKELHRLKDNPQEQQKLIAQIKAEAPETFKVRVMQYYEEIANGPVKEKEAQLERDNINNQIQSRVDGVASEIAENLQHHSKEDREALLNQYKDDKNLHSAILSKLDKR